MASHSQSRLPCQCQCSALLKMLAILKSSRTIHLFAVKFNTVHKTSEFGNIVRQRTMFQTEQIYSSRSKIFYFEVNSLDGKYNGCNKSRGRRKRRRRSIKRS